MTNDGDIYKPISQLALIKLHDNTPKVTAEIEAVFAWVTFFFFDWATS